MGKMKDIAMQLAEQGIDVMPEPSDNLTELLKRASITKYTLTLDDCSGHPRVSHRELQDMIDSAEDDHDLTPEEFERYAKYNTPTNSEEYSDQSELDSLLDSRSIYGSFKDKAEWIQGGKQAIRDAPKWEYLGAAEQEALDNIMQKIGRILYGEPHIDSWADIAGYSTLVVRND